MVAICRYVVMRIVGSVCGSNALAHPARMVSALGLNSGLGRPGTRSPRLDDGLDAAGRLHGVFVLPDTEAEPPGVRESTVRVAISLSVRLHLGRPEPGVGPRDRVVLRTPVPETSVEEDCDLHPAKHHVSSSSDLREWPSRHSVAKTQGVDHGPERYFRLRVPALVGLHTLPNSGRRCPRLRHTPTLGTACRYTHVGPTE